MEFSLEEGTLKHLSPSKIEAYLQCPEKMRLRYVAKIAEPASYFLTSGTVVHSVFERALKRVMAGGKLPDAKEADDMFLEAWDGHVKEEESKKTFIGWQEDPDDPRDKIKSECRALVPFVFKEVLPAIKPRLIEENLKLPYDSPAGPFIVWGKLDLLEENGTLTDWKTTRKVSKNALASWLQLAYYSKFVVELTHQEITQARKLFFIRGPRPKFEIKPYTITPSMRAWADRIAVEVWMACQAQSYVPRTDHWGCSSDWCSFYSMCFGEVK